MQTISASGVEYTREDSTSDTQLLISNGQDCTVARNGLDRPLVISHIWGTGPGHRDAALDWALLIALGSGGLGGHGGPTEGMAPGPASHSAVPCSLTLRNSINACLCLF